MEASTDGQAWTTLRSHRNDASLADTAHSTAGWAVAPRVEGGTGACFSHFRVRQTGKNSSNTDHLFCAGIELYGELELLSSPV